MAKWCLIHFLCRFKGKHCKHTPMASSLPRTEEIHGCSGIHGCRNHLKFTKKAYECLTFPWRQNSTKEIASGLRNSLSQNRVLKRIY